MKWYCKNGVWSDGAGAPVKVAPLQLNYHDKTVPWEVAAEGYKEYSAQYGTRQSLPRLCERGGFSATELCILLFERIKRIEQPAPETRESPADLVGALQDKVHTDAGPFRAGHGAETSVPHCCHEWRLISGKMTTAGYHYVDRCAKCGEQRERHAPLGAGDPSRGEASYSGTTKEARPFTPMDREQLREKIAAGPDPEPEIGAGTLSIDWNEVGPVDAKECSGSGE